MESAPLRRAAGRPPLDPSGAARTLNISLSPKHLGILDGAAKRKGVSRSEIIRQLLERVKVEK